MVLTWYETLRRGGVRGELCCESWVSQGHSCLLLGQVVSTDATYEAPVFAVMMMMFGSLSFLRKIDGKESQGRKERRMWS